MELPQEIDDYIKESIQHTLGLPVSRSTLELKLQASEEAQSRLRDQCLLLHSRLKEKDQAIERARAESSMSALALKKFVEENQKLASECAHLLNQCNKLEKECSLYDNDREALMDFGNEADQRAKEAELRVQELEEEVRGLSDELQFYKRQCEACMVDSSLQGVTTQDSLLESVLATLISGDDAVPGHAFLEANSSHESCLRLLEMWNFLKPSTQKVLSLAAEFKALEKDKEHLRTNLYRAEEEVKLLFEENNMLDEENKKLLMKFNKERNQHGSSGKHASSAPAKSNKRKSSSKTSSLIEKKIDFSEADMPRPPLSPLRCNSPDSRMHKK
ncbi:centlein [Morus notabilis]|uniref:centlein n=1 Tax=Morus notabilis TaxID=981085 RepID=UPI000CED1CD9|nr:centlein [Morus notabilis]